MIDISTGKQMVGDGRIGDILSSGIAPAIVRGDAALQGSANASVGGMMRNVGARVGMMGRGSKPAGSYWGLRFTSLQDGSSVSMIRQTTGSMTAPSVSLEYSTDAITWFPFVVDSTVVSLNSGDFVYIRSGESTNATFCTHHGIYGNGWNQFLLTGRISSSGDISSILNKDTSEIEVIPDTYCFYGLFNNCTSLVSAPYLPATTPTTACYYEMFKDCTYLETFQDVLPIQTVAGSMFYSMFDGCVKLSSNIEIMIGTISGRNIFQNMFKNCSRLNRLKVHFTDWTTTISRTSNWLSGVSATGTFVCPTALPEKRGANYIPEGWTIERF